MKKIFNITLICMMVTVFCSTTHSSADTKDFDRDVALIPYNKILTKLSKEYGIDMYIPEKNKEKFLNKVKGMTPKEFEKLLRQQYNESKKYITSPSYDKAEMGDSPYPQPIPNAEQMIPATPLQ